VEALFSGGDGAIVSDWKMVAKVEGSSVAWNMGMSALCRTLCSFIACMFALRCADAFAGESSSPWWLLVLLCGRWDIGVLSSGLVLDIAGSPAAVGLREKGPGGKIYYVAALELGCGGGARDAVGAMQHAWAGADDWCWLEAAYRSGE
jgi:hypothetical protein